jgi:putative ABC transport system permease protein
MKWIDIFRMSVGNLRRNLMRTVLTISGVVVGIGAIVFLVSIGYGIQNLMVSKVANLEALTLITVRPNTDKGIALTEDTVKKFKSLGGVSDVSPILSYPAQMKDTKGTESETILYGIQPDSYKFENINIDYGASLSGNDAKEAIVSVASMKNLNLTNPTDAIGKELSFRLIVLDTTGKLKPGHENDVVKLKIVGMTKEENTKYAYVPLGMLRKVAPGDYASAKVKTSQRSQVNTVRKAIESMGYPTTSIKDTVDQIDNAFVYVRGVLWGFGLIALFVAAIGIFNTMTISLLERTHEIGIMKAIGGRNKDVSRVFTMEASLIGLGGGILGVSSGYLLGVLINLLVNFLAKSVGGQTNSFFYTPPSFVALVIGFSFLVSTIAGIYPARRAAKLNPLEALRYE